MRRLSRTLVPLACLAVLSGCRPPEAPPSARTIVLWEQEDASVFPFLDQVFSGFRKLPGNEDVRIVRTHYHTEDLRQQFLTASIAGSPPDLIMGPSDSAGVYSVAGFVLPVDGLFDLSRFNQPVVDEYIKRYGVNPRIEPFDKEKLRRLRGEFYTAFLEKTAVLVKGSGRKFCLHVPDMAFGSPTQSTMMEIHWDWRSWVDKGIPDEVTFKIIFTDNSFSPEGLELIKRVREKNIPVSICPFLHAIPDLAGYLGRVETLGVNAFTVYEAATLWAATREGFKELNPPINKILQKKFRNLD